MNNIELEYHLQIPEDIKITNITIADQKNKYKSADEFNFNGKIYIDIEYDKDEQKNYLHFEEDIMVNLSRSKYKSKDIELNIGDYRYNIENDICHLYIKYNIKQDDSNYEEFCSLEDDNILDQLRDYLHRNKENHCIDEDKIIIIDPIIEEKPHEVEVVVDKPVQNEIKEDLFKESYQRKYKFYRLKKDETLETIADKFNVSRNHLLNANKNKIWKENILIQIPQDE